MELRRIYPDPRDDSFYLDAYLAEPFNNFVRKALIICPGGGYSHLSSFREGEAVAQAFMPYGYNCFVLTYSLSKSGKTFPAQLIQAAKSVQYVRQHAEDLHIDPEKVLIAGFSAGGHLAGSLATMWDRCDVVDAVGGGESHRPDGAMLLYPVVTQDKENGAHSKSFYNLLGTKEPTQAQLDELSLEQHVTDQAVPAFIMHTTDDETVGVGNSLVLAQAYTKAGVPFEMHIYTGAAHGSALVNDITKGTDLDNDPRIGEWVNSAAAWANTL